jgi:hypothetical protein
VLHADDQIRIGDERHILKRFLQVSRTYLAGSPGPMDRFGQAYLRLFVHDRYSFCLGHVPADWADIYQISAGIARV